MSAALSKPDETELLVIERLAAALEKCASVDEIKDVCDRAKAIGLYARTKAGGLAAAQAAGRVVTDATMKLAELYAQEESAQGARRELPDRDPEVRPGKEAIAKAANMDPALLRRVAPLLKEPPAKIAAAINEIESCGRVVTPSALLRETRMDPTRYVEDVREDPVAGDSKENVLPMPIGNRHQVAARRREQVRELHASGKTGIEIAETLGISHEAVSRIKVRTGIRSAQKKLAADIDGLVNALEGVCIQVDAVTARLGSSAPESSREELYTCSKRLNKVASSIRRLSSIIRELGRPEKQE